MAPSAGFPAVSFALWAGPSIPRGRLKENAVFRGTLADVLNYLADVIEDYPQIPRLIVPTNRLATFAVKVKTPGNIAHKYYTDIVSAMKGPFCGLLAVGGISAPLTVRGALCALRGSLCGRSGGFLRVVCVQRVNDLRFRHAVVGRPFPAGG